MQATELSMFLFLTNLLLLQDSQVLSPQRLLLFCSPSSELRAPGPHNRFFAL